MNRIEFNYYWYLESRIEKVVILAAKKKYPKCITFEIEGSCNSKDLIEWEVSAYSKKGNRKIITVTVQDLFNEHNLP